MTRRAEPSPSRRSIGRPRAHLRRTDSTNERLRLLALSGAPHGTLLTAGEQTAGRGRHGRAWWAPPGGSVLMSLLLRHWPPLLPLAAAVAVCEVVGGQALLKWPNDVLVANGPAGGLAKIAGILTEGRPQDGWVVLGIGLNVALDPAAVPRDLGVAVASMGRPAEEVEQVLGLLLDALEGCLAAPQQEILARWRARDVLRGRRVSWKAAEGTAEGIAEGVDDGGRLLVRVPDGSLQALASGEVHLI